MDGLRSLVHVNSVENVIPKLNEDSLESGISHQLQDTFDVIDRIQTLKQSEGKRYTSVLEFTSCSVRMKYYQETDAHITLQKPSRCRQD